MAGLGIIIDNWMYIEGGEYYTTGPTGLSNTSYRMCVSFWRDINFTPECSGREQW